MGSEENGNWSSFQLANSTPPLSVTGSAIAPSARMTPLAFGRHFERFQIVDEPHVNEWNKNP